MNNILENLRIELDNLPKVTKDFDLREYVSPDVYNKYGNKSIWFVNPVLYSLMQFHKEMLEDEYEGKISVVINSWHYGGNRKWSGHRTYKYINQMIKRGIKTATLSQHIGGMCNATDSKVFLNGKEIPAEEIRKFVLKNEDAYMNEGLTTIESGKWARTWNHMDCRPTALEHILIVGA